MATLLRKGDRWSIQFRLRPNEDRGTIALGIMSEPTARGFKERVEALVDAIRADNPPDPSTCGWVARLSEEHHAALARVRLVVPRDGDEAAGATPTLAAFIDRYIKKREANTNDGTRVNYRQAKRHLVAYFGATRPLDKITAGDADDFFTDLLAGDAETKRRPLSENTARRICGRAKQFFRDALRHKLIAENPFGDMKCSVMENRQRDHFISREEAQAVLDACPDAQWRLLFALSRFGGLRCPSEHLRLQWQDVDWEHNRFTVHSPKTARKGKPTRLVPIFRELRPYLDAVWEQVEPGTPGTAPVITRYRDRNSNLRTQLERIIRRAGREPWEKLFQNLRATRATELVNEGWPEYKVCKWLGHIEAVAKKHYWQVTDDDYQQAAGLPGAASAANSSGLGSDRTPNPNEQAQTPRNREETSSDPGSGPGRAALHSGLQISSATGCSAVQDHFRPNDATADIAPPCTDSHSVALYCTSGQVTPTGFEPVLQA